MTGSRTRVLIVDDSSSMRALIGSILSADNAIDVVGSAADGIEAVEKALALKPDLITMDVEMPRMDGITALKQIMAKAPSRVIMLSSITQEGARTTFEALDAGAIDYVPKRAGGDFGEELRNKIKEAVRSRIVRGAVPSVLRISAPPLSRPVTGAVFKGKKINVVGIGASTGGPVALLEVLSRIPACFPYGIVIAIHMPKAFTGPYAERINGKCAITIREAMDGDIVKPGVALIAPGGAHTSLVRQGTSLVVRVQSTDRFPQYVYTPSVDLMLSTLAEAANGQMLGVILTGMGNDGFRGMQMLKQKGGITIVQDEATSTIYGMPKVCVAGGVADTVLPLGQIGNEIAALG